MLSDRVKFLTKNDFLYGYGLEKIESIQVPAYDSIDINDAIEFFHINAYFRDGARAKEWSDEQYNEYTEKSSNLYRLTSRFFNALSDDNIIEQYLKIDSGYTNAFWTLFDSCKLYNKISAETFTILIHAEHVAPEDLFTYKTIVNKYGIALRDYILENECLVRLVVGVYEQEYSNKKKLFLPVELSGDDICAYFQEYINGEHPNINLLDSIQQMKTTKQFPITDELRLSAKRRREKEIREHSQSGITFQYGANVSFSPDLQEVKNIGLEGWTVKATYNTNWLLNTLDNLGVIRNFKYLFEYVDNPQSRCTFVSKRQQSGLTEAIMRRDVSCIYPENVSFATLNALAQLQLSAYYAFLDEHNICLEGVLDWFFTQYLQNVYGCPELRLKFPSKETTYSEKCSLICAVMDSLLKQFSIYVKHGEIDFELVSISSGSEKLINIPSLTTDKYLYGCGEIFERLTWELFSDQCMLSYVSRLSDGDKSYRNFFELLSAEKIYLGDYRKDECSAFDELAKYNLIIIAEDGEICLGDNLRLGILFDLYKNDVISRYHYPVEAADTFEEWKESGMLRETGTLFSEPESNYLNYLLNKAEFTNGLDLRNKYMHGVQQILLNEEEHKNNYFILLRVMVLIALKIDDDLYIKHCREVKK